MTLSREQRDFVRKRAGECCEYCRMSEGSDITAFQVDHIRPLKHRGSDDPENLCFSCYECNAYKGSNVGGYDPATDDFTMLFNPRDEEWQTHFHLEENARISGRTATGRTTVDVLRLNEDKRVKRRHTLRELGEYPCLIEGGLEF